MAQTPFLPCPSKPLDAEGDRIEELSLRWTDSARRTQEERIALNAEAASTGEGRFHG